MNRYSNPPYRLWTRNTDPQNIRVACVVLGVVYPALHFFTALEDPGRQEPLWQYQLVGAAFLAIAAASLAPINRAALRWLFHGVLLAAAVWAIVNGYMRGYRMTRLSLNSVVFGSALFILSPRILTLYTITLVGGIGYGLFASGSPYRIQLLGRVLTGAVLMAVFSGMRLWARNRDSRHVRSLESLVQGSPVPTLLLAHDVCQLANDAAARLLGIASGEDVRDFIVGEPPWWLSRDRRGRAQAQLRTRYGSELWCEISFAPVAEEPNILQVTLVDKTADRDQSRIKDELLASISRELRPPLMTVKRALVAGAEAAGAEAAGEAGAAMRSLQRVDRLLEDMLLIHSLTGDAARDELRTHPAAEVCEQARALVSSHAQALGVTVRAHCPADAAPAVRTDMQAAGHALAILLTTAVDSAEPGGLVTVRVEQSGRWVDYEVESEPRRAAGDEPDGADIDAALPLTIARSLITRVGGLLKAEWPAEGWMVLSIRLPAA